MEKAQTTSTFFSRSTEVAIDINAPAKSVWKVLTDAENFASWNSTVVSFEGEIKQGETIKLVSTLDPKRTFKLRVKELVPEEKLVWGDAQGARTYTLEKLSDDETRFRMHEKIGGPLFPLFAKMIPPFDESFNQFAKDLKNTSES